MTEMENMNGFETTVETTEGTMESTFTPYENGVIQEETENQEVSNEPKAIFLIAKKSFLKGAAAGGTAVLVGKTLVDKTVSAIKKKLGEKGDKPKVMKHLALQWPWKWVEVEEKKPAEPTKDPEPAVQNTNSTPAAEKNNS